MAVVRARRARRGGKRAGKRGGRGKRIGGPKLTGSFMKSAFIRPNRLLVKLPYSDFYSFSSTSTSVGSFGRTWNTNSLFDPDRTGVGHQPLGHSLYNQLYTKYRVIGMSYSITVTNTGSANTFKGGLVTQSTLSNQFGQTSPYIYEQPNMRRFDLGTSQANKGSITLKGFVKNPYVQGQSVTQYKADDNNYALNGSSALTGGTSPVNMSLLTLLLTNINTANSYNVPCSARFIYHVEYFDPQEPAQFGDTTSRFSGDIEASI